MAQITPSCASDNALLCLKMDVTFKIMPSCASKSVQKLSTDCHSIFPSEYGPTSLEKYLFIFLDKYSPFYPIFSIFLASFQHFLAVALIFYHPLVFLALSCIFQHFFCFWHFIVFPLLSPSGDLEMDLS